MSTRICLMGPTASGKTALACRLVQEFPLEIISVDSAMIYRGMDIGTAKPSSEELALAPHHLIDILNPDQSYSAAQFCEQVESLCQSIEQRGNLPLLVGGTMMYFHALQQGLASLPDTDAQIRQDILAAAEQEGWDALYARLQLVDPKTAAQIHAHDKQRLSRALEVYYQTGQPMSLLLEQQKPKAGGEYLNLALFPEDRSWLHGLIDRRFEQMLAQGLIEEVQGLLAQWPLDAAMPALRCVGYRQVYDYLQAPADKAELLAKGQAATRQLAKRQLTWLRHWPEVNYFDPKDPGIYTKIVAKIEEIVHNHRSQS